MKIVVIGCGNILAGDDGIGIEVVKRIRTECSQKMVRVIEAGVPGLNLLNLMAGATKAILVDAVFAGGRTGQIYRFTDVNFPEQVIAPMSVHGIGLREALIWGRKFEPERLPGKVVIIGIQVASVERWKIGLSPQVAASVERAVAKVHAEIYLAVNSKNL